MISIIFHNLRDVADSGGLVHAKELLDVFCWQWRILSGFWRKPSIGRRARLTDFLVRLSSLTAPTFVLVFVALLHHSSSVIARLSKIEIFGLSVLGCVEQEMQVQR
ncbi:hypothetical protein D9M71_725710 [compost metagenome]